MQCTVLRNVGLMSSPVLDHSTVSVAMTCVDSLEWLIVHTPEQQTAGKRDIGALCVTFVLRDHAMGGVRESADEIEPRTANRVKRNCQLD